MTKALATAAIAGLALLGAAHLDPPQSSAHVPKSQPCGRGHLTLAHNNRGRVYKVHGETEDWEYFGCTYRRPHRSFALTSSDPFTLPPPSDVRLRGYFAGLHQTSCAEGCHGRLIVVDLRTGRARGADTVATDFELRRTGSFAYVRSVARTFEVWRVDRSGRARLDVGTGIDQKSLTLTGTSLTWRHDGHQRSAQLD